MHSNNRALAVLSAAVVSMAIVASSAAAADGVVIGSVNPVTGQTTLLTDKFKKHFPDGGPISEVYLLARPGSAGYALVRAGRTLAGACHTELIATEVSAGEVYLPIVLVPLFSCEEVDGRCRPKDFAPVLCMPTDTLAGCACKPAQAAANLPGPRCQRVNDSLWHPELEDILTQVQQD